jgi:hypothetical protein
MIDMVLFSGDVTAQALPQEFSLARQELEPILSRFPTIMIQGYYVHFHLYHHFSHQPNVWIVMPLNEQVIMMPIPRMHIQRIASVQPLRNGCIYMPNHHFRLRRLLLRLRDFKHHRHHHRHCPAPCHHHIYYQS